MISFRVEARKWSSAPQGVRRLSPLERELRDARDVGLQPDEPGVSMARAADASRWQTSSQAYGAFYKLPPREKVKDPQHSLLVALAPAVEPPSRETAPAASASAADSQAASASAADSQGLVLQARVVPQPGDGACLFHSLAHGNHAEPLRLRHAIADFIESQPDALIGGEPLRAWVKWESRLPPALYAARMRGAGCWGGAIEIAVRRASRSRTPCTHAAHASSPTRCRTACARACTRTRSARSSRGSSGSPCTCTSRSLPLAPTSASRASSRRTTRSSRCTCSTAEECTTTRCIPCE